MNKPVCAIDYENITAAEARKLIREGTFTGDTVPVAKKYVQANLAILRKELAYDFLLFCQRNPAPCPLIEATDIGSPIPRISTPTGDIRTDLPAYRIWRKGELVDKVDNIKKYWQDDMVAFLIGCSHTFERSLELNGIPVNKSTPSVYITNIPCIKAGVFEGPVVVSSRVIKKNKVVRAVQITTRYHSTHGAPLHVGDPKDIGIDDITKPDFGNYHPIAEDEVPIFWACGITPQAVAMTVKPDIMITHEPGHMFITDIVAEQSTIL
jgi:uncharacterized protein YcsI (UPF0317 family)